MAGEGTRKETVLYSEVSVSASGAFERFFMSSLNSSLPYMILSLGRHDNHCLVFKRTSSSEQCHVAMAVMSISGVFCDGVNEIGEEVVP